jgi:Ser-tRNA(Ala) deacylase AlaX
MRMSTVKRLLYKIDTKYKAYIYNVHTARHVSLFLSAAAYYVCSCVCTIANALLMHCKAEVRQANAVL